MHDKITYEYCVKVIIGRKHVGDIKEDARGFYYQPKGSNINPDELKRFPYPQRVKQYIEFGDD